MNIEFKNNIIHFYSEVSESYQDGEFDSVEKIDHLSAVILFGNSNVCVYYEYCTINEIKFNSIEELMDYLSL
jgi:hypothetical protein